MVTIYTGSSAIHCTKEEEAQEIHGMLDQREADITYAEAMTSTAADRRKNEPPSRP